MYILYIYRPWHVRLNTYLFEIYKEKRIDI